MRLSQQFGVDNTQWLEPTWRLEPSTDIVVLVAVEEVVVVVLGGFKRIYSNADDVSQYVHF